MIVIQSRKNQYLGINAHLHSYFQNFGGWASFHNTHITHLAESIAAQLPAGYTVDIEQSMQSECSGRASGPTHVSAPTTSRQIDSFAEPLWGRSPLSLRLRGGKGPGVRGADNESKATLTLEIVDTLQPDEHRDFNALIIYKIEDSPLGKPVTRIELLSPTNKPGGTGAAQYIDKRELALRSGLPLVEIDYLHETPSPIRGMPSYRHREPDSYPYTITISDPRPTLLSGKADVYGFGVDEPVPTIDLPLAGSDVLRLDFDSVYQQTFEKMPAYGQRVNYAEQPERFNTYSEADQAKIRRRMQVVRNAYDKGLDLEQGPFDSE